MFGTVEIPLWGLVLILGFAAVTFASHFLFPSVRWFFRRRMERGVARLNRRLQRPVEPFKLLERHDRIQQLVYDPEVMEAVLKYAHDTGVPRNVAFEKAKGYAAEIVPGFSATIYFSVAVRLARWLSQLLYRVRVTSVGSEDALQRLDPDATLVFVMNHRSNMDYVLVTWLVSSKMTLSYAVGEWARVWPLSWLIRSMGAYFIRRKHLNPLYRKILQRYVQISLNEGVTQAIFPEGGLSLTGKVGAAKLGLLSYMLEQGKRGGRPILFIPVGLNYDRVLEDRLLVQAQISGIRRFQAKPLRLMLYIARMFWLRLRGRWRGFGEARVNFGPAIPLQDLLAARPDLSPEDLGRRLMADVQAAIPIQPHALVAQALGAGDLTEDQLIAGVAQLQARLTIPALRDEPAADLVARVLPELLGRRLIARQGDRLILREAPLLAFQTAPLQQMMDADAAKSPQGKSSRS